jgi:hypothetical protein
MVERRRRRRDGGGGLGSEGRWGAAGLQVSGCGDGRVEEEGARHAGRLRLDWAAPLRPILSQAVVASWVGLSPKPHGNWSLL